MTLLEESIPNTGWGFICRVEHLCLSCLSSTFCPKVYVTERARQNAILMSLSTLRCTAFPAYYPMTSFVMPVNYSALHRNRVPNKWLDELYGRYRGLGYPVLTFMTSSFRSGRLCSAYNQQLEFDELIVASNGHSNLP